MSRAEGEGEPIVAASARRFAAEHGRPKRSLTSAFGIGGADWVIYAYVGQSSDIRGLPRFYDGYEVRVSVIGKVRALAEAQARDEGGEPL